MHRQLLLIHLFICLLAIQNAFAQVSNPKALLFYDTSINYSYSSHKAQEILIEIVVDTANTSSARPNAIFKITNKKTAALIFEDSIFSSFPQLLFKDVNRDSQPDILAFYQSNAKGDEYYYLYTFNATENKFSRVANFEQLRNPSIDKAGIILSCPEFLQENCRYYLVTNTNLLHQLF